METIEKVEVEGEDVSVVFEDENGYEVSVCLTYENVSKLIDELQAALDVIDDY